MQSIQSIQKKITKDGICVLTFDRPDSSANIFDLATLTALNSALDAIAGEKSQPKGLIITSAKDAIFVAGADLHAIQKMSGEEMKSFIALGQTVFSRIANLPYPTVAAVHGAAVGGGYEICLACDWRVASPASCTKLGLPETKLGIVPAWGGCTRLPRLIGVPRALDIILGGKTPSAKHARKLGMVDEVVPREHLIDAAKAWLKKGKHPHRFSYSAPVNAILDVVIAPQARHAVMLKTRGHYPAPPKALEVVIKGATDWNENESLAREREAVAELITLDSTMNLLRVFFLQERARKLSAPGIAAGSPALAPIRNVAVIGAGLMGAGIAQWLSSRGLSVILRDVDAARVAAGMASIDALYAASVKKRVFTEHEARVGRDLITPAPVEIRLPRTDLVIEAAVETMDIKKSIFRRLDELVREDAVLATNTSALSISELAAATKHPQRVVGFHFFNPVHQMQLVEVVVGRETTPEIAQRALRFAQGIGKLPVLVKDSPGFLVNRILLPYMIEAAELFRTGASIEDIDEAMLDFGMPMGPLRLTDEVGVDVALHVASTLAAAFPERLHVPEILPALIQAGLLGRKVGKGFYEYPKGRDAVPNPAAIALRPQTLPSEISRKNLARRMSLLMVNEAARCVEEGLVEKPGDVDFAMVMGTGFAPFRGGPLRVADRSGAVKITDELSRLAESAGPQYAPCALLQQLARSGKRFYED
jgi:3-hydroxyacyl-CoA dehydrogenase/enoyl-CoA hydratase/3-hydroxybutyryl-CoA epimerase